MKRIAPKPSVSAPSTLSVAILAFHNSTEILKETLQKSRTSLPSSKFYVATSDQDREIIALCKAVAIPCIEFTRDVINKDSAEFNYAGIARAVVAYIKNDMKIDQWILLTRPQVVLHSSLADIDLLSLAKDSLYGCGLKSITSREELLAYTVPEQPGASEVRELVPNSAFLLAYSETPKFDAWSADTESCVSRYSSHFVARYMIHLKLAYLGVIAEDDNRRVSIGRWGVKSTTRLRIEPVHAFATQQQEQNDKLQAIISPPPDTTTTTTTVPAASTAAAAVAVATVATVTAAPTVTTSTTPAAPAATVATPAATDVPVTLTTAPSTAPASAPAPVTTTATEVSTVTVNVEAPAVESTPKEEPKKVEKNLEPPPKKKPLGASTRFFTLTTGEEERSGAALARSEIDSQQNVAKQLLAHNDDAVLHTMAKPKSSIWASQKLLD